MICVTEWRITFDLSSHRRDPHCVEAHSLNVVQVVLNTSEASATVHYVCSIARRRGAAIAACETIREYLVYAPASPLGAGCCEGCWTERQAQSCDEFWDMHLSSLCNAGVNIEFGVDIKVVKLMFFY